MADTEAKVQDLQPVDQVHDNDNLVLEQNGKACRMTANKFINFLITACDRLGILGLHVGSEKPSSTQNVWIEMVKDYQVPDEAFYAFDARYPLKRDVPTKISQLTNDSGYLNDKTAFDDRSVSKVRGWHSQKISQSCASALVNTIMDEIVAMDDVSSLPHVIGCKVSGVSSMSSVVVRKYGKNIYDTKNAVTLNAFLSGSKIEAGQYHRTTIIRIPKNETLTVSKPVSDRFALALCDDNTIGTGIYDRIEDNGATEITIKNTTHDYLAIWYSAKGGNEPVRTKIQVEIGNTGTAFELANDEAFTPDSYGVVSGITSLAPCMMFLTDTPGAKITINYNQSPVIVNKRQNERIAALENLLAKNANAAQEVVE